MKLSREQYNILTPPKQGGGGKGKDNGTEPIDSDSQNNGEGDGEGDGDDKDSEGSGQGSVTIQNIPSGTGGVLTDEQSAQMQKDLGVPYENKALTPEKVKELINKGLVEGTIPDSKPNSGSTQAGSGSAGLRAALAKIAKPQVDWKKALKKFIGRQTHDTEEHLGHRNFIHSDDYIWTEKDKDNGRMRDAVCAIDVSGSMSDDNIAIILTEIKGMVEAKKVKNTTLVYFHSDVEKITKLTSPGAVKKYTGENVRSGGTEFKPPLEIMQQEWKKDRLELALFLTDGYADLNLPKPKFVNKFIWVILDNPAFVAPWGKMVVYVNSHNGKI